MPSREHVSWAKFRVLAVTAAAMLILGTISFLLTGGTFMEPKTTLYLYLDDATGLSQGSPVRVDGIGVGKVETVELSGSNEPLRVVRVSLKVDRDWLDSITVDSTAQASSDTMVGDKFVDIASGTSPQHIEPGGELKFKGTPELMKSIDLSQFEVQVRSISKLLDDIEGARTPLGQFIAGDELYKQLLARIADLQHRMREATRTTSAVGEVLYTDALYRRVMDPIRQLDASLAKLHSGQGTLGRALRDNQQYEQVRGQLASLKSSLETMQSADMIRSDAAYNDWTRQLRSLIRQVDDWNANPLMTTSAAYENVNGMARELQETIRDLRTDPRKYLRIKVF
jgi:phospholipid/cholesterol/gamma-HCH transport system substrate-binding protein